MPLNHTLVCELCYPGVVKRTIPTLLVAFTLAASAACSHVQTVRLQPSAVHVGEGMRPIAGIQANATSAYFLFVPIPGDVDLDRVVNRMLIVTAKTLGADKVVDVRFEATPDGGIWALRKLVGWVSAQATGIAVEVLMPADKNADAGPEPAQAGENR